MTSYRITACEVQDFKRVRHVRITPDADATVVLIGGKNAQGKSSVLDAMTAAFGGKRQAPVDPVRHGAEAAGVTIELDNGMVVHRTFSADGTSALEVRDPDGPVRSPQAVLDKLVSNRFLDPLAFVALPPLDQRATLLKLVDSEGKIAAIEEKRLKVFDHRTEVGRDLKKAEGELARLPAPAEASPAIDVASLAAERAALSDKQQEGAKAAARLEVATKALAVARGDLEGWVKKLDEAHNAVAAMKQQVAKRGAESETAAGALEAARAEWAALQPRREEIDAQLAKADAHNRAAFAAEESKSRRAAAEKVIAELAKQRDEQTQFIDKMENCKLALLAAAKLPVEHLGFDEKGVTLNGVPFAQASGAEKLRVALALAIAGSPNLRDIWIKEASALDDDSLAFVAHYAAQSGYRVWLERVGSHDLGAIVIHDGQVVG